MATNDDNTPDAWKPILNALKRRQADARVMGGPEKLEKHGKNGLLNARQRVEVLCDPKSFSELGTLVGGVSYYDNDPVPADGLVAGMGLINGHQILVGAEDFTIKGGSIGIGTHAKRMRLTRLAARERVPLIMLLEGAGERATNAFERYPHAPNDLQGLVELSGLAPTVAVIMGPSAGHGALTAPLMDFVIMVEGSALFSAGPPLVAAASGVQVTKEELGGARLHAKESGVIHNIAKNDTKALQMVRTYLGYFLNRFQAGTEAVIGKRCLKDILNLIPADSRKPYDARKLVQMVADSSRIFEVQPDFGASILTVLARLGGHTVAIVANQPNVKAGSIDRDAGNKAARFLEIAGSYSLPVIFLADNPGVLAGTAAERAGTLRSAARMFAAQSRLRCPKLHVTIRKAYGFGSSIMAMNPFDGQTLTLAFPGATLGAMPAGSGGTAAGLEADAQDKLEVSEAEGPWKPADSMSYDEIIDPRELRNELLKGLALASKRLKPKNDPVSNTGILP